MPTSAEKQPLTALPRTKSTPDDQVMTEDVGQSKRTAVHFLEKRPKFEKSRSYKPPSQLSMSKHQPPEKLSDPPTLPLSAKPAMLQDIDDGFGDDGDEDSDGYDGVPKTEEVPMVAPIEASDEPDKMEITLDRASRHSTDPEVLDVPLT